VIASEIARLIDSRSAALTACMARHATHTTLHGAYPSSVCQRDGLKYHDAPKKRSHWLAASASVTRGPDFVA